MLFARPVHPGLILPWMMREDNQAAIIAALAAALVAAVASVIVVLVRWHLDRKDAIEQAHTNAREREKEAADHAKELADARKAGAYKEIAHLQEQVKHLGDDTKVLTALQQGVQNLEFAKLQQLHDRLAHHGYLSDASKRVADRVYQSYHALGGNGLGSSWHTDIMNAHSEPNNKESNNDKHGEQREH